jgi:hypothetical protein
MSVSRHHFLRGTPDISGRSSGSGRWMRQRSAASVRPRTLAVRPHPLPEPEEIPSEVQLRDLWDRHGTSAYQLACALLGNDAAAQRAVTMAMSDLADSGPLAPPRTRRSLVRHVFWRSQELSAETPRTLRVPPTMVWLGELAQLQRACLALCLFGGQTHREAAGLLGVPAATVAGMLTSGLRDLGHRAAGGSPCTAG